VGERGARAKVLGAADGNVVALVEAEAGYHGTPHEHDHAEFFNSSTAEPRTKDE
jgi:hypothetical protein